METERDTTLLALVLSCGRRADDPAAIALVERFGDLGTILNAEAGELQRTGVAPQVVQQLEQLRTLFTRAIREEACRRPVISSWSQLLAYVRTALAHQPREQFRALYLDRRNCLIREEWVADGSVDHAPVYPREVVRRALELNASSMILVHNHPSGDPSPSTADIEMTRKVIDAARVFNIVVHDHVIVGREGTASFKSMGLI
ncbi:DNA repair protein RadC [Brevundimonas sp.]|uniref:RadC family protein n=1 Tax=Brevundimonas sp. TaxID=1871086 RepID=UPI0035658761